MDSESKLNEALEIIMKISSDSNIHDIAREAIAAQPVSPAQSREAPGDRKLIARFVELIRWREENNRPDVTLSLTEAKRLRHLLDRAAAPVPVVARASEPQDIDAFVADLLDHYNTDFDTTVPGKEFRAEIKRIVLKHCFAPPREEAGREPLSREQVNQLFWEFCEESAINGAFRIVNTDWRLDDLVVDFVAKKLTALASRSSEGPLLVKLIDRYESEIARGLWQTSEPGIRNVLHDLKLIAGIPLGRASAEVRAGERVDEILDRADAENDELASRIDSATSEEGK